MLQEIFSTVGPIKALRCDKQWRAHRTRAGDLGAVSCDVAPRAGPRLYAGQRSLLDAERHTARRMVTDKDTGKSKGYGFCEYHDVAVAQSAVSAAACWQV